MMMMMMMMKEKYSYSVEAVLSYFVEWTVDVRKIKALSAGMKELQHYL